MLGKTVTVTIDRPLGSTHPKYKELVYPINYGYIKGVIAGDGQEQDAYVLGVNVPVATFTGVVIAVIHRHNDVEEKWVVAPNDCVFTQGDIKRATAFTEKFFDIEIRME